MVSPTAWSTVAWFTRASALTWVVYWARIGRISVVVAIIGSARVLFYTAIVSAVSR
jgi:hypothetical protein